MFDSNSEGFIINRAGLNGSLERFVDKTMLDTANQIMFAEELINQQLIIKSFELTIVKMGHDPLSFTNSTSGQLTERMKDALKRVNSGNKIYIENIKVETIDKKQFSLYSTDYIVN